MVEHERTTFIQVDECYLEIRPGDWTLATYQIREISASHLPRLNVLIRCSHPSTVTKLPLLLLLFCLYWLVLIQPNQIILLPAPRILKQARVASV